MNESEKELSSEESLKLINRMIYEAKGYFYESGIGVLIWGFTVFFVQAWIQMRENKMKKAKTFTDETIDYVWTGFFLSAIAAFSANFAGFTYMAITIVLFLTGFATFLTGMIAKFSYHKICSVVCLLLGNISFFVQNSNVYLLLAFTAIIVWIIPGFILNITFKKQQLCKMKNN